MTSRRQNINPCSNEQVWMGAAENALVLLLFSVHFTRTVLMRAGGLVVSVSD